MNHCLYPARKFLVAVFCLLLVGVCSSLFYPAFGADYDTKIEIPSSWNPVGSGARALGMGGAFIAVADDATAASWNPGGLIQLKHPEISLVGAAFHRREENTFGTTPESSGSESSADVSKSQINYLSAACPFTFRNRNMIISLNYQNLFDFTRHWKFPLKSNSDDGLPINQNVDCHQEGNLFAHGIAYCIQVIPDLSLGLTVNIWEDGLYRNEWKKTTHQEGTYTHDGQTSSFEVRSIDRFSLSGMNAHCGVLWKADKHLTIGAVFKTPFQADLHRESRFYSTTSGSESQAPQEPSIQTEKLDMPASYGVGIAYRFCDEFTASVDIYRTEWNRFILTDPNGNQTSPISGQSFHTSDIRPTTQVRIGAEYLWIAPQYIVPLRGGIFYDPAPAEGSPDDYFGFSLGTGIAAGRFVFDIAYQYRFGNDVGDSILQHLDFSQDIHEHTAYASLIVHW
ncbi:MAG: outer membrane protein transport protein [bacterium]